MEKGVSEWWPKDIGWWLSVTQAWDIAWLGPIDLVLCQMWKDGFMTRNDDSTLARAARVSLKAWKGIRAGVGAFLTVKGEVVTQDFLEAKYREACARHEKFSRRNSENVKSSWEKRRARKEIEIKWRASDTNGSTNRNTNGKAIGITNGVPMALPMAGDRASSSLSIDLDLKREEGSNASPVPVAHDDRRVDAVLAAYPRKRWVKGASSLVNIPVSARADIAEFMEENPNYPLLFVVKWYAKNTDTPQDLKNFLSDPPAPEAFAGAYERACRERDAWRAEHPEETHAE